jgi:hypothetical protein
MVIYTFLCVFVFLYIILYIIYVYGNRMKLTRNKIRKIRKQVLQSVRKWKKGRNSIRRKVATFRRSPRDLIPKRRNVFNKTLKKYIPIAVLEYLKEKYLNMRQMRRKQRRMKMIGGEGEGDAAAADAEPAADAAADAADAPATDAIATDARADAPATDAIATDARADAPTADAPTADAVTEPTPGTEPATTDTSSTASSIAAAAVAAAKASNNTDNSGETGKEGADASKEGAGDATEAGDEARDEAGKEGADAGKEGADAGKEGVGADVDKKKGGGFSLGPDIPGDISIHSETHELKDVKLTWKLIEFLVKSCIPYYIQLELKDKVLNKHDTDIFDLRRILYGKYVTEETLKKAGDKQKIYFKPGSEIGIADGDSISADTNTDIFIYTGEKVSFDPKSKENAITLISAPKTPNEKSFVVTDSKRLYQLSGDSPSSIDSMEDVGILGGNSIDISEFRLQVAPLSEADLKKAVATASSNDGDKKKRKKIVTDDTNSYVVNLSTGCKVTSIQTLRKSLEVARASLEDEDDVSKKDAMDIIKMINGLLENPEFAKNDGFDDFKEKVFGFSYKIPGSERKYGIAQLMTFFETEKDNLPKDLTKAFFMLLTLLGHGPAGENGACLAFDRPQSMKVIKLIETLANGDIITTEHLGNDVNMEGLGSEIDKLNASNKPKEGDDAKKAEDAETKTESEGATGAETKTESEGATGAETKSESEGATGAETKTDGAETKTDGAETKTDDADAKATNEETATPHDNTSLPTADEVEEINAESIGEKYKAYIIKHFKFPNLPEMVLVHFMGWGLGHDEIMAQNDPKISVRTATSKEGPRQSKVNDLTKEDVVKLYTVDQMKIYSEKAKSMSKELFDENTNDSNSIAIASIAAATAAAAAAKE